MFSSRQKWTIDHLFKGSEHLTNLINSLLLKCKCFYVAKNDSNDIHCEKNYPELISNEKQTNEKAVLSGYHMWLGKKYRNHEIVGEGHTCHMCREAFA